jgi:hypothetical protein
LTNLLTGCLFVLGNLLFLRQPFVVRQQLLTRSAFQPRGNVASLIFISYGVFGV